MRNEALNVLEEFKLLRQLRSDLLRNEFSRPLTPLNTDGLDTQACHRLFLDLMLFLKIIVSFV